MGAATLAPEREERDRDEGCLGTSGRMMDKAETGEPPVGLGEITPIEGWDEGITRGPLASAADAAWSMSLSVATVDVPPTLIEQASGVVPMF